MKDSAGTSNGARSDLDLVRKELLTGCTLITGWVLEGTGVEDKVEVVEVEVEVEVEVTIDEELVEAPIVPDGFLQSAT